MLSVTAIPPRLVGYTTSFLRSRADRIDSSPVLRRILKSTFYAQYCCGENRQEIALTVSDLRRLGFTGVVLAYAKEGNPEEIQPRSSAENKAQMQAWLEGNLETVRLAERGDCIAVKYTGAGDNAIIALKALTRQDDGADHVPEIRSLREAMHQVCQAAKDKGVRVLMDAEQQVVQRGIDILSLELMSNFNASGEAVVYNTYQMYLKASPQKLLDHLQLSREQGFVLGAKIVRGAYLHTEPVRSAIHNTKKDTDAAYDAAISYLLMGKRSGLFLGAGSDPDYLIKKLRSAGQPQRGWVAEIVVASHNTETVKRALALLQSSGGQKLLSPDGTTQRVAFAQLMGMADELSLYLAAVAKQNKIRNQETRPVLGAGVDVFKYTVWGSSKQCLLYMLRRAEENKDALARSRQSRAAVVQELRRRLLGRSAEN